MRPQADGNRIVVNGKTVTLRGANVVNYFWKTSKGAHHYQQFDHPAIRHLLTPAAEGGWGGNAATIWIAAGPVNRNEREWMDYFDGAVEIAEELGKYVILSYAGTDPNRNTHPHLIPEEGIQAHAALARRYKDVPNVLFACQAEPGGTHAPDTTENRIRLRDVQERTIDAIRAESPHVLVFVSGSWWSQRCSWLVDIPVRRENIAIKPHIYGDMPRAFTSNGVWAVRDAGYPVMVGEFGSGSRMSNDDVRELIATSEENKLGWQAWNFNNEGSPLLLDAYTSRPDQDKDVNRVSVYGQAVCDMMREADEQDPKEPTSPEVEGEMQAPVYINVGGQAMAAGVNWMADQPWSETAGYGHVGGSAASHPTVEVQEGIQGLHNTERWGLTSYSVRMDDPLKTYDVKLLLAETYDGITGPGERVFTAEVGEESTPDIDPWVAGGGFALPGMAEINRVQPDENGVITVEFVAQVQNPAIKGLVIVEHEVETEPPDDKDARIAELEEQNAALNKELEDSKANLRLHQLAVSTIREALKNVE